MEVVTGFHGFHNDTTSVHDNKKIGGNRKTSFNLRMMRQVDQRIRTRENTKQSEEKEKEICMYSNHHLEKGAHGYLSTRAKAERGRIRRRVHARCLLRSFSLFSTDSAGSSYLKVEPKMSCGHADFPSLSKPLPDEGRIRAQAIVQGVLHLGLTVPIH